jgi:hypothetical protein
LIYEDYSPAEPIPLKQFFKEGTKAAREVLSMIKLTPKKKVAETAPRDAEPRAPEFKSVTWTSSANQRADHNAVWVYSGDHVHFVLYFDGFLQTGLSGETYKDTNDSPSLWKIRGHINAMTRRAAGDDIQPADLNAGKIWSEPR